MRLIEVKQNFKNKHIFYMAMTHSSYSNETSNNKENNERLEFLGDSILGFIITSYLYKKFNKIAEGELTKIRSNIICEETLYKISKDLKLGNELLLSKGEDNNGGRLRKSILADSLEALIGAIFIDQGLIQVKKFILFHFESVIKKCCEQKNNIDYKTILQEKIQKNKYQILEYILIQEIGPDHDKKFIIDVFLNKNKLGRGYGSSKKRAEQMAAKYAIKNNNFF